VKDFIKAIRGMNDILPEETYIWHHVEDVLQKVFFSFGYEEIRLPILEKTELFKRTIGEATDIVEKEMYTFLDRNNESLTLRPEGTAGCVRAGIENGLLYNQTPKLWYMGPNFRYERPQKGRYRQFYQCGAEAFGIDTPDIDAEVISLSAIILEKLGLKDKVTLEINSLGTKQSRTAYRETLIDYLTKNQEQLDEDSKRRLTTNPMRILDSKNPKMQDLINNAPKMLDVLDQESKDHFNELQAYLSEAGIKFIINPCLVRGLDYYTKTVFEWTTSELGAQGTVCAGGRYDGLTEQLGGKPTPALGFAMGLERIILLLKESSLAKPNADVYFLTTKDAKKTAIKLATEIRRELPHLQLILNNGNNSFKSQFKKADKSGAKIALILGDDEINSDTISVKYLREDSPQESIQQSEIINFINKVFKPR